MLSEMYYNKALQLAKDNDLNGAVIYAARCLGIDENNTDCKKLAGLCYYQLGKLKMAQYCFSGVPEYENRITDEYIMKKARTFKNMMKVLIRWITMKF